MYPRKIEIIFQLQDTFETVSDPGESVERERRTNPIPMVHYGSIRSSNAVIKYGRMRDMLREMSIVSRWRLPG
jgi:hypothetical protein